MRENKIIDISHLILIKNYTDRQMEVEYPYEGWSKIVTPLPFLGSSQVDQGRRKPIDIFTGLGEIRKKRVMWAIARGKR